MGRSKKRPSKDSFIYFGLNYLVELRDKWCRGEDLNLHGVTPTGT